MKIEIIFVFILISSIYSDGGSEGITFTASGIATGTCTSGTYTFKVNGALTGATTGAISITATFSSPSTPPTATCSLPKTDAADIASVAIECSITSVLNDDTITISAMTGTGVTFAGLPKSMGGTATCAASEPSLTFTASSIPAGTCGNDGVFTFKVSGTLSAATSSAITLTPAFSSPATAPTVTCSLPATASGNVGSAAVECKVTSALNSDTITVSGMTGTGITLSGFPKSMSGTATCSGKTNDAGQGGSGGNGGNGDDAKFIQLSKFLMIILFFIF